MGTKGLTVDVLRTRRRLAVTATDRPEWKCPRCEATPDAHGNKPYHEFCTGEGTENMCMGFICECESTTGECGTYNNVCPEANCHHCGWGGQFPSKVAVKAWKAVNKLDPKKLTGWKKEAWDAGWRPTK